MAGSDGVGEVGNSLELRICDVRPLHIPKWLRDTGKAGVGCEVVVGEEACGDCPCADHSLHSSHHVCGHQEKALEKGENGEKEGIADDHSVLCAIQTFEGHVAVDPELEFFHCFHEDVLQRGVSSK